VPEEEHQKKIDPFEIGIYAIELATIAANGLRDDCISNVVETGHPLNCSYGAITNLLWNGVWNRTWARLGGARKYD
jgi:hypothetical protein